MNGNNGDDNDTRTRFQREREADEIVTCLRGTLKLVQQIGARRKIYEDARSVGERSYLERAAEGLSPLLKEYIGHPQAAPGLREEYQQFLQEMKPYLPQPALTSQPAANPAPSALRPRTRNRERRTSPPPYFDSAALEVLYYGEFFGTDLSPMERQWASEGLIDSPAELETVRESLRGLPRGQLFRVEEGGIVTLIQREFPGSVSVPEPGRSQELRSAASRRESPGTRLRTTTEPIVFHDIVFYDAKGNPARTYKTVVLDSESVKNDHGGYVLKSGDGWIENYRTATKQLLSFPLFCAIIKKMQEVNHPGKDELRAELKRGEHWMVTGTWLDWENGKLIHDYERSDNLELRFAISKKGIKNLDNGYNNHVTVLPWSKILGELSMLKDKDELIPMLREFGGSDLDIWTHNRSGRRGMVCVTFSPPIFYSNDGYDGFYPPDEELLSRAVMIE